MLRRHAVIVLGAILCAVCLFAKPGPTGLAMNADSLLPFSFLWDITHHAYAWDRGHQLPRIPSFIPDLLIFATLYLGGLSSRWTMLIYGILQLAGFIYVGGFVASRIAGRSLTSGCAIFLTLFVGLVWLERATWGADIILSTLLPVAHCGPFLFSVLAGWLAACQFSRPGQRRLWGLAGIGCLVYLSDRLLLIEYIVPLLGAGSFVAWFGPARRRTWLAVGLATIGGVLAGDGGLAILRHTGLRLEHRQQLSLTLMLKAAHLFLQELPAWFIAHPVAMAAGFVVPMLVFLSFPARLAHDVRAGVTHTGEAWRLGFLWGFAGLAMAGCLVFAVSQYVDTGEFRYLTAFWTWPLIFFAAWLLRFRVADWSGAIAGVATLSLLTIFVVLDHASVALLHWDQPVAVCLRQWRGSEALRAGLAGYWQARPIELALDWTLQVDQITEDGHAYVWGNDSKWYDHSFTDPSRPPPYDFIVIKDLYPDAIASAYGIPDRILPCGDTEVWIYDDPNVVLAGLRKLSWGDGR